MRNSTLAALAALLLTTSFCARRAAPPLAPLSAMRPNAFIRVGETNIFQYDPERSVGDAPTGYTGTVTVNKKANTITIITGAQITVTGIDLYEDERAAVAQFSVLPDGSYRHIITPADKGVKVGDVELLWIAGNF